MDRPETPTKDEVKAWYNDCTPGEKDSFNRAATYIRLWQDDPGTAWFGKSINPVEIWNKCQEAGRKFGVEQEDWKYLLYNPMKNAGQLKGRVMSIKKPYPYLYILNNYPDGTPYPPYPKGVDPDPPAGPWLLGKPDWVHALNHPKHAVPDRHGINWNHAPQQLLDGPGRLDPTPGKIDPSELFNDTVPKEYEVAVLKSLAKYPVGAVKKAWGKSQWDGVQLVPEDVKFYVMGREEFFNALPYVPIAKAMYNPDFFVCRSFASAFVAFVASTFRSDAVGKCLDWQGEHSYDFVVLHDDGQLSVECIEPQLNNEVPHPEPEHHYTGSGMCVFGG